KTQSDFGDMICNASLSCLTVFFREVPIRTKYIKPCTVFVIIAFSCGDILHYFTTSKRLGCSRFQLAEMQGNGSIVFRSPPFYFECLGNICQCVPARIPVE